MTTQKCVQYPLGSRYKVVNQFFTLDAVPKFIYMGPPGPANTEFAWMVMGWSFGYNLPLVAGGFVLPFYQTNSGPLERGMEGRIEIGRFPTDRSCTFPFIGGCSSMDIGATDGPVFKGRERPLYVPTPNEIGVLVSGAAFAGVAAHMRALVLEVPLDYNVSEFF